MFKISDTTKIIINIQQEKKTVSNRILIKVSSCLVFNVTFTDKNLNSYIKITIKKKNNYNLIH